MRKHINNPMYSNTFIAIFIFIFIDIFSLLLFLNQQQPRHIPRYHNMIQNQQILSNRLLKFIIIILIIITPTIHTQINQHIQVHLW